MCDPVSAVVGVIGALTYTQQKQAASQAADAQAQASQQAAANATKAADQADQANNRANGKQPDIAGIASANEQAAKGGGGSTMLTGPQGIDPKALLLGKTTLLGA